MSIISGKSFRVAYWFVCENLREQAKPNRGFTIFLSELRLNLMDPSQASEEHVTPDLGRRCPFRARSIWVLIFFAVLQPFDGSKALLLYVIPLACSFVVASVWQESMREIELLVIRMSHRTTNY